MNPETGIFLSMDTYQGDLYEPVTLHKYLYANGNPVKYSDPSGMFSLPECNIASAISAELYRNQNVILGMSILNGIGKSVMTGLCGGDGNEMKQAFLEGMIEGAAMVLLFSAVAAVMAVYSVSEENNLSALIYAVTAAAGIISVCKWWGVNVQVDYVGERGIARFGSKVTGENIEFSDKFKRSCFLAWLWYNKYMESRFSSTAPI